METRNNMTIRSMGGKDIDRVMQIWLDTNMAAHGFISENYWKSQYENVRAMIPAAEVYVCEVSSEIVGFVGLTDNYIAGIFVAPGFQSRGIGQLLLDYIKSLKQELSLHVYSKNERAVKFYKRGGFVTDSESTDTATGEPQLLMRTGCQLHR